MAETETYQTQVALLPDVLGVVVAVAERDPLAGFLLMWDALGVRIEDLTEPFRPWSVAIPEQQWGAIASALAVVGGIDWMLTMMNKGPSSYKEEESDERADYPRTS